MAGHEISLNGTEVRTHHGVGSGSVDRRDDKNRGRRKHIQGTGSIAGGLDTANAALSPNINDSKRQNSPF